MPPRRARAAGGVAPAGAAADVDFIVDELVHLPPSLLKTHVDALEQTLASVRREIEISGPGDRGNGSAASGWGLHPTVDTGAHTVCGSAFGSGNRTHRDAAAHEAAPSDAGGNTRPHSANFRKAIGASVVQQLDLVAGDRVSKRLLEQKVGEVFDLMDEDGSGELDIRQLGAAFHRVLGVNVPRPELCQLVMDFSDDGAQRISCHEFQPMMIHCMDHLKGDPDAAFHLAVGKALAEHLKLDASVNSPVVDRKLNGLFAQFDHEGKDALTRRELEQGLRSLGVKVRKAEFKEMLRGSAAREDALPADKFVGMMRVALEMHKQEIHRKEMGAQRQTPDGHTGNGFVRRPSAQNPVEMPPSDPSAERRGQPKAHRLPSIDAEWIAPSAQQVSPASPEPRVLSVVNRTAAHMASFSSKHMESFSGKSGRQAGLGGPEAGGGIHVIEHTKLSGFQFAQTSEFAKRSRFQQVSCWKSVFGIGATGAGMPKSSLIYPLSRFSLTWVVFTAILLLYTAVVTPPVIAFYWNSHPCTVPPTLYMDMVVDIFFLIDIVVSFCTGFIRDGKYEDSWPMVAKHYLAHGFLFDVATSIPVSFVEFYTQMLCSSMSDAETATLMDSAELKLIRVLKPLRWFKLARILKMTKLSDIGFFIGDRLGAPPRVVRLFMVILGIMMGVHIFASLFWFVKILSCSPTEVLEFLDSKGLEQDTAAGMASTYVLSFYFVVTVWTTVGFGDMSATNTAEQIFCVFTMITGSVMFAVLISEVQEVQQQSQRTQIAKTKFVSKTLDFLQENDVPEHLQQLIIDWTRFSFEEQERKRDESDVINDLPHALQTELIQFLYAPMLCKVGVLGLIESVNSDFLTAICERLTHKTVPKGSMVIHMYEMADRLILIWQGLCSVEIEVDDDDTERPPDKLMRKGNYLGEFSFFGEGDWGNSHFTNMPGRSLEVTAIEYVTCLELTVQHFEEVMETMTVAARKQFRYWKSVRDDELAHNSVDPAYSSCAVNWTVMYRKLVGLRGSVSFRPKIPRALIEQQQNRKKMNPSQHADDERLAASAESSLRHATPREEGGQREGISGPVVSADVGFYNSSLPEQSNPAMEAQHAKMRHVAERWTSVGKFADLEANG